MMAPAAKPMAPAAKPMMAPAAKPMMAPAKMKAPSRREIAKSCTRQANAKHLHHRAWWKFRSECEKNGGMAK
jgi:hypothetical protein